MPLHFKGLNNNSNRGPEASILGEMTHVASLKFQGGKKKLEIVYNVMQRPVYHDQRAYSTGMLQ